MNSQNLISFLIFLLLAVTCISKSLEKQQPQQPQLYNIQFNKPYTLNETIEVINAGTPQEELVVKGRRIIVYLTRANNGTYYSIKEISSYTADTNGYRVKTRFELSLINDVDDKLGFKTLKASVG